MRCLCLNPWFSDASLKLCDECLALFARGDVASILKSGMKFVREPYDPATMKCELCLFFSARYFKRSIVFPDSDGGDNDFLVLRKIISWLGGRKLACLVSGDLKTDQFLEVRRWDGWWPLKSRYLKISVHRDSSIADDIVCRPITTDLKSDGTFAMIKEWLAECDDHHDCFKNLPPIKLPPTHLINVTAPGHSEETVVLEKVDPSEAFPKYATLSYVWGSSQSYMTTSQNYPFYQKGIVISSLGKGLQDAIWVTRKLGLRYLWIDALCIIQDSTTDKMQEIARMDSIYTFSYITISASSTISCMQSFLSTKPQSCIHRLSGIEIPFGLNGDRAYLRVMDRKDDGYNINWQEELEPIHRRSWTFQEHFMSSRMLLFKDFQIFWICTKTRGRDGGWIAADEERSYGQQWNLSRRTLQSPLPKDWLTICRTYSNRKLTDPNDKLSALSSIASYFATAGNTSYVAGIWMTNFVDQLAWRAKDFNTAERPKVWTAPSWSWASLDCPISFPTQDYEDRVAVHYLRPQIITWRAEPVSEHAKFGQLKSASLQIRGLVLKCLPRRHENGDRGYYDLVVTNAPTESRGIPKLGPAQLFFDINRGSEPFCVSTIQGIQRWDDPIHCLLLRVEVSEQIASQLSESIAGIEEDKVESLFCLALRQLENGDFYRVGTVAIHPDYRGKGWLGVFEQTKESSL